MFEYIVTFAILLSNIANFPQIYKIAKTKSAKDLSLSTFILWSFITFVMMIHSIKINDIYFKISLIGQFIINVLITGLIIKYKG